MLLRTLFDLVFTDENVVFRVTFVLVLVLVVGTKYAIPQNIQ